jgi:NADH:ubiquinone oxidoreductase subunit
MGIFGKIFTWWDGATVGTLFTSAMTGELVGTDAAGNRYYRGKKRRGATEPNPGSERRWVIYEGANDASRVPAYRPAGALERGGKRAAATGDYEAWSPEA